LSTGAELAQPGRYRLRKRLDADRDPPPHGELTAIRERQVGSNG
jgi:hypothetical protein